MEADIYSIIGNSLDFLPELKLEGKKKKKKKKTSKALVKGFMDESTYDDI